MLYMKEDETIDTFTIKLTTLVNKAASRGHTMEDRTLVRKLLNDVPDRYLQIVASIEQYSDLSEMTLEEVIGRLKTYEERIKYKKGKQVDNQKKLMFTQHENKGKHLRGRGRGKHRFSQGRNHENFKEEKKDEETSHKNFNKNNFKKSNYDTSKLQCYKCKKIGHIAPKYNGASNHMTGVREHFKELNENVSGKVRFGDGSYLEIKGKGSIIIECDDEKQRIISRDWKDYMSEHINDEPEWTDFKIENLEVINEHHDQGFQPIEEDNEFPNNDDDYYASPTRDSPTHSQTPHTPSTRSLEVNSQVTPNISTQSNYQSDNVSIQTTNSPSHFDHTPVRGLRTVNDLYENTEELLLAEDKPKNYKEASIDQKWIEAMKAELDFINRNNTWKLTTLPKGHKAIGVKWVFKTKRDANENIIKHKAKLVAKGYIQEHGIDFEEVFAPVARMETIRLLLPIAANNKWEVHHLNVKSAFLHGDLKEEVYVTQPEGFVKKQDKGKVYRLIKSLYGLRQAPHAWNIKLDNTLKSLCFKKCALEQAIYTKTSKDSTLLIGVYVDDLIITGTPKKEIDKFKAQMEEKFEMSDLGLLAYYLGIEFTQTNCDISIRQSAYANKILKEAGMIDCNETLIPMDPGTRLTKVTEGTMVNSTEYRSIIGCLRYLLHTRTDLSYSVGLLSRFMQEPREQHMKAIRQVLRYVKGTKDHGITYKHNGGNKIHGYSDIGQILGKPFIANICKIMKALVNDRNVGMRIVLSIEDKLNYLEQLIPPAFVAPAGQHVTPKILAAHTAWIKLSKEIAGLVLMTMEPVIQRNLENLHAHEMLLELKTLFAQQVEQELLQTTRDFHSCKQEEGQSVSSYVLKMKGYTDNLESLGHPVTLGLGVSLILINLRKEFDAFVQNYNMHSLGKTINELHAMLKLHEQTLPKNNALALHAIRAGKVQKVNKHKKPQPQMAARGQSLEKGKNKLAYAPKPKIPPPPKREDPAKDLICHEKRTQLRELVVQGLRASRKLKPGALSFYVGNGQREAVEAIGIFYLCLTSGLEIVLNNCHYPPSITRGVIFVSRLYEDGFINCFVNNIIQVSRNNMVYFSAIPRDDIFEIDLSNSYTNESSIYAVRNKRAKLDLDSALLAFEKCVSCTSGKMARKPYTHQVERVKDLLGLIHTDVCGPFKIMSRKGASYFVTFTDNFSRYDYVYLLKHKHEVFEFFKVFQKEVENQLGKTIKLLRSDREGEYMSQEFLDHLKDHGIIFYRTPPNMPQHNGVPERRNKTLLDMVRSMISQTTLPKFFWDCALETAACILNMVSTKKVEKTPYEVWHGQAPKSTRTRHAPDRMCLYIDVEEHELGDLGEPANYKAALLDPESEKWLNTMNVEMQSMKDNEVWVLVELPPNGKTVGSKWLFKKKTDIDRVVHTYKARLVAKGSQTPGIDYEETFSPVADIRAIRILIAIAAYYDYEIWQMDVKTAFLNGYLNEEVYMEKPEGFVDPKYPNRGMQNVPYASAVGSIMYAVRCTHPDVAFAQNVTSRFQQNPGDLHWTTVKNILKYLRNTKDMFLVYGGWICCGVVDWKSAKQSIFATSSAEAKYIAAFDAFKEAVWVIKIIYGLGVVPKIKEPISMYCDNTGAIAIAKESGITKVKSRNGVVVVLEEDDDNTYMIFYVEGCVMEENRGGRGFGEIDLSAKKHAGASRIREKYPDRIPT
nr:ribonuclease H-like domain, reverse transcriptase, RNA-dependent DNA polymerase [Tanacetum cinerariifolium]